MTQPFVGEVKLVPYNFAPRNYALCNGQLLAISQNTALFSILGTQYGGNGTSNFALPDLRSRAAVGEGNGTDGTQIVVGEQTGTETVTVLVTQYPAHSHTFAVNSATANAGKPAATHYLAATALAGSPPTPPGALLYAAGSPNQAIDPNVLAPYSGGNQGHANLQPYLCLEYIIAMFGVFPARN